MTKFGQGFPSYGLLPYEIDSVMSLNYTSPFGKRKELPNNKKKSEITHFMNFAYKKKELFCGFPKIYFFF